MGVTKKPTVSWLKRGTWTFCRFKGGLGKKEGGGGWYPNVHCVNENFIFYIFAILILCRSFSIFILKKYKLKKFVHAKNLAEAEKYWKHAGNRP